MQINETLVLENGKLITPIRLMDNGVLVIKEGKIIDVGSKGKVNFPRRAQKIDVEGGYISPGFIDLHVHGGGGRDALEGEEALKKISTLMRLIVKCKGVDRICLVTEATNPAGMPPGEYVVGGLKVIVEDGVTKLPDRTAFAGSVATMNLLIRNMVQLVGVSLPQAVKTATLNPAKVIKVAHRKGTLTPGKDADLTIFDEDFDVKMTIVKGRVIFSK